MLSTILRDAPRIRGARDLEARARRKHADHGGTFAQHRAYTHGDDLRMLDWNVYARTGELFLKQLEDDDRRTATLLIDVSPSMDAGPPRRVGALRLAAILGGLALVRLDGLRIVASDRCVALQGATAVERLLDVLATLPVRAVDPLDLAALPLQQRFLGRFGWISDFAEPDTFVTALRLLRLHGRAVTGWLPSIADDQLPNVGGVVRLLDPETGREETLVVDGELRRALEDELRMLARRQDALFRGAGYPLVRFPLPASDDYRAGAWFERRWTVRL